MDTDELHKHLATSRRDSEAVTVASNDEAARLNDRIRDERTRAGIVDDTTTTTGNDGLNIGSGDLVQTRQNRTELGVANRQQWIVQHVEQDGSLWVRDAHRTRKREHSIHLPAEYVREHTHLSYAATAYGVQGVTVPASHTVLTASMGGAAVYVGMTRGRNTNTLHVVAEGMADARAQFIEAMERDSADRGLSDATERATLAVRGFVADGSVKLVNDRIAQLIREAERAEQSASVWERLADHLAQQRAGQQGEKQESADALRSAEATATQAKTEAVSVLMPQAIADGETYLTALAREQETASRAATVGRLGRRKARQEHQAAKERTRARGATTRETWGSAPNQGASLEAWTATVVELRAESDPRVIDTAHTLAAVTAEHKALSKRQDREHMALITNHLGGERVRRDPVRARFIQPAREEQSARSTATAARDEAETLRTLPPEQAAERIEAQRAEAEIARELAADRARRLHDIAGRTTGLTEPRRGDPGLRM